MKGIRFCGWWLKEEKEAEEDMGKKVDQESVKIGLRREDALC